MNKCYSEELNLPLQEALQKVRTGDISAFETVVARFQEPLRAYVLTRASNPAMADDLAQMAFVTAFEKFPEFNLKQDFEPWLFGIAGNLVRRTWEQAARDNRHSIPLEDFYRKRFSERSLASSDDSFKPSLHISALRYCMEKLSERWRKIVALHYEEKCTIAEIASKFGNKPKTVGVTLFRIRQNLKECIQRQVNAGEINYE